MILNFRTCLIKKYLSKELSSIEQKKNQLRFLPNYVKSRINLINQLDTDYVMVKNKAILTVSNTIKKLYIQKSKHIIYKQDFYKNKEKEIGDFFLECLVPVMDNINLLAFIEERKKISILLLMKKSTQRCKVTIN